MSIIKGGKVFLRPITMDDTKYIIKWRNTEFVRNSFIFRSQFTPEMHVNWMNSKVKSGEVVQYIITDTKNKPIGSVYFRNINKKESSAEFGIFIGEKDYLGKGYGQEATSMFVEYGFAGLNLNKILLRVIASNKRAIHVYEKAGFKKTRIGCEISQPSGDEISVVFMELNIK